MFLFGSEGFKFSLLGRVRGTVTPVVVSELEGEVDDLPAPLVVDVEVFAVESTLLLEVDEFKLVVVLELTLLLVGGEDAFIPVFVVTVESVLELAVDGDKLVVELGEVDEVVPLMVPVDPPVLPAAVVPFVACATPLNIKGVITRRVLHNLEKFDFINMLLCLIFSI